MIHELTNFHFRISGYKKIGNALIFGARDMNDHEMKNAKKNKTYLKSEAIPEKFSSVGEASEFWNFHRLADYLDETTDVHFDVEIDEEPRYFILEKQMPKKFMN